MGDEGSERLRMSIRFARVRVIGCALVLLEACSCKGSSTAVTDAAPSASASVTVGSAPASTSSPPPPPSAPPSSVASVAMLDAGPLSRPDGGASACKLLFGPVQQPMRGPALLVATGQAVDLVFNKDGRPFVVELPAGPIDPAVKPSPHKLPDPGSLAGYPRCARGGSFYFCADRTGGIRRSPVATSAPESPPGDVFATSRAGTRIDAVTLGSDHALLGYLWTNKTTEGFVTEAWVRLDDAVPVRISEDGTGATTVDLAPRGAGAVAMTIDTRAALTAVHARPLLVEGGKLVAGADAVVFIGGPPERATTGVLAAPASGIAWALVPLAKDATTFGTAIVRVEDPPRVDAPVTWSAYPNGVDPAPIAATQGKSPIRVARVRPVSSEPSSPKVLELGRVDGEGTFTSLGIVSTDGRPRDIAVDVDPHGALWLYYTDASGGWIERRACP
jgi:hypothetical protein